MSEESARMLRDGNTYGWSAGMRAIRRGLNTGNELIFDVLEVREDEWLGTPVYELLLAHSSLPRPTWVHATYCEPA
jgi:hypothetical protein